MTHKENAPFEHDSAITVKTPLPSPSPSVPSHMDGADAPTRDPAATRPERRTFLVALGQQIQKAHRGLFRLIRGAATKEVVESGHYRVLMCFSSIEERWYCAFFDEAALYRRLPRRLTFRDSAKVYETARRGGANLADPATLADFKAAVACGRGKVWLDLSLEQRQALGPTVAG